MTQDVLFDTNEGVATITLNRPQRRNALSNETIRQLSDAMDSAADDPAISAAILTAAGPIFCSGAELSGSADPREMLAGIEAYAALIEKMQTIALPLVAKVKGPAMGGGIGLVLACDLAVASEEASFTTPEIKVGMFPMMIMALIFRHMGRKRGMELIFSGEPLSAPEALEAGWLNRCVPADDVDDEAENMARRFTRFSPKIVALGKQAYAKTCDLPFSEALQVLKNELIALMQTDDSKEGIRAFLEKRPPRWTGK